MTSETCWCCNAQMKNETIPFMKAIIHWCHECQPDFNIVKFAEEYNFDA